MTRRAPRVLFVPCGSSRLAVTRVRILEHLPALRTAGYSWTVAPALSDSGSVRALNSPRAPRWARLFGYCAALLERIARFPWIAALAAVHDLVFLQRVSFPFGLNRLLRAVNPRIVFDFDDAIFMADPSSPDSGALQRLKGRWKSGEFRSALRSAELVIAGNSYLGTMAAAHASNVVVLTEAIDTERYRPREWPERPLGPVIVGWIGSPSTVRYLDMLAEPLSRLAQACDLRLRLIGAEASIPGVVCESFPWSRDSEVAVLQTFDIGLMPMPKDAWTEGKFGSKMLQYMAVAVPAVVSDTAANRDVVEHGVTGMLAQGPECWTDALSRLTRDYALRRRIGQAGRAQVERRHSLVCGDRSFVGILDAMLGRTRNVGSALPT